MKPNYQNVFTEIVESNSWNGKESKSGEGSDLKNTLHIIREIPTIFKKFNIKTILDIPCGDFNWFKHIDVNNYQYIGADIVESVVDSNNKEYGRENIKFLHLDIVSSDLPTVDLIICRDCLIHFPNDIIKKTIINIKKSKSKFILTTSHNWKLIENNKDINFGQWRRINLEEHPFNFPSPVSTIFEGSIRKADVDRMLCLWKISDLPDFNV
jgi:2-polyprenyl-3-methyl-5-hydroxy-6-metoxy-1,4-benzoquinol methylase